MKRIYILFGVVFAAWLAVACGRKGDTAQVITVSIEPQRYLLERIVGDAAEVNSLLSSGDNPENFDPSMSTILSLGKSRAYFLIGNLGFEQAMASRIREANPSLSMIDSSKGVSLLHGTHGECHVDHVHAHSDIDPHVWSSARNARIIARNMYMAMVEIDPDNRALYTANYEALDQSLDSLDRAIGDILAGHTGEAFMVWHPSLSYFADDYGLEQIAVGAENKEMSVRDMKQVIEHAREHKAKVLFLQPEYDGNRSAALNTEIGAKTVTINPLGYDLPGELLRIANAIAGDSDNGNDATE